MGFLTNVVQRGRQATRLDLVTAQVFTISLACNIQIHGVSFITDLATLSSKGTMRMAAMLCSQAESEGNFEPHHEAVNTWLDDCIEARTRTERKTLQRLNEVPIRSL